MTDDAIPWRATVLLNAYRLQQALDPGVTEALSDAPLRPNDFGLYSILAQLEPARPSALASVEGVSPSTMTATLRRLEARGHVLRLPDPDDRRAVRVELSPAGREALSVSRARFRAYAERVEGVLGEHLADTRAALVRMEQALLAARGVAPTGPAPASANLLAYSGPALSAAQAEEVQGFIRWLRFRDEGA